ncbi:cold-shock protein [Cellulomonas sp. URHD0024]|uniref:cold-shock protein n=1 Tax=Cellulomonas sp. URHD0024 TaxID=1302620 RepID=UPI0004272F9A|nr:cold shock domain-containing protein [Cellulomonas sp. URHD0024]
MPEGTVRWFDAERGFGFLSLGDEGEDLFVHASEIVVDDDRPKLLREGQVVEFEVGEGDRGPQARRVRVTGDHASDAPLGVLGTVSWYEPGKGYGFVTPDGGGAEIFVHSSAIVGGGVISDGQRVAFLVVDGEKGPQADHLLPLGAQASRPVAPDGADGTVSWYDVDKGFGFVTPDAGGEDAFAHVRDLAGGLAELSDGDRVTFDLAQGDKGPQARNVRLVGGSARHGAPVVSGRGRSGPRSVPADPVRGGEGLVARYDADRGFGFITPDAGGADLFVHVSVVRGAEALQEGDRVRYKVRQSDRGPQADSVERA